MLASGPADYSPQDIPQPRPGMRPTKPRMEFHPESRDDQYEEFIFVKEMKRGQDSGRVGSPQHLANWVASIRSRKKPACPAEAGVAAVYGPHLGNLAYRSGKVAHWPTT